MKSTYCSEESGILYPLFLTLSLTFLIISLIFLSFFSSVIFVSLMPLFSAFPEYEHFFRVFKRFFPYCSLLHLNAPFKPLPSEHVNPPLPCRVDPVAVMGKAFPVCRKPVYLPSLAVFPCYKRDCQEYII